MTDESVSVQAPIVSETVRSIRDEQTGLIDLSSVLQRMVDECEYTMPSGAKNCRYCDCNMDHEGTYENMHTARCVVRDAQAVLRYTKP